MVKKVLLTENSGVSISDLKYTGSNKSIGVFYSATTFLPITKGLVLSTGIAKNIDGPNDSKGMGSMLFLPGDADLDKVAKNNTADAAILEFTFYPNTDKISFSYFFASEEYPEFVNHGVNDVFAFFISGPGISGKKNLAMLQNLIDPVTVDHINSQKNSNFFIENKPWNRDDLTGDLSALEISFSFQFDGLTTLLEATINVIPYQPYHLKIAIADVGDNVYDSGVFLKAKSFKSNGEKKSFTDLIKKELSKFEQDGNIESYKIIDDKIIVHSNIQFDFNSFELLDEYFNSLDCFAKIMQQYFDLNLILIGHTDAVGTDLYNKELSFERANSIKNYLVKKGIATKRIKVIGKGNTAPITDDNKEESRALNRRVEFIIQE